MATAKLIQLFEDVLAGNEGIKKQHKNSAKNNADWFYKKCKSILKLDDNKTEELAQRLIDRFLYVDPSVLNEITKQYTLRKENPEFDKNGKIKPVVSLELQVANYLKKKLRWYFNVIQKDINLSPSVKISKDLLNGLIKLKLLPEWTDKEVNQVIRVYHNKYREISIEHDDEFSAYKRLNAAYERISKYPVKDREAKFFISIVGQFKHWEEDPDKNWREHLKDVNKTLNKYKSHEDQIFDIENNNSSKKTKKINISQIQKISLDDDNAIDYFLDKIFYNHSDDSTAEEQLDEINKKCKEIINIYLPPREALLFEILREVTSDPLIRAYKQKEIFDICKERLLKEGINSRYFDKLKSSLLKILTKNRGDGGMLHFTLHDDAVSYFYNLLNSLHNN